MAGLARRVHDTTILKDKFDKLVQEDHDVDSRSALTRRVPTRWNSDFACLDAHVDFKNVIQQLTGVAAYKLSAYRLTDNQWSLADDLVEILLVFDEPTRLFSQVEVPLIPDVVPMLYEMEMSFLRIRDADGPSFDDLQQVRLPNTIRVAAQAALLLINKYFSLTDECELYQIAIGKDINSLFSSIL